MVFLFFVIFFVNYVIGVNFFEVICKRCIYGLMNNICILYLGWCIGLLCFKGFLV